MDMLFIPTLTVKANGNARIQAGHLYMGSNSTVNYLAGRLGVGIKSTNYKLHVKHSESKVLKLESSASTDARLELSLTKFCLEYYYLLLKKYLGFLLSDVEADCYCWRSSTFSSCEFRFDGMF